jgi:hypothetical protein
MAHNPVNHPLRPTYRVLGLAAGAYLVLFGIIGLIQTSGESFTGHTGVRVFGQQSNMLWSLITIVLGALVIGAGVLGRNLDVAGDKFIGWALLAFGSFELATSRTDASFFGFSISTVVVTYLVGLVLIMVSLYSKVVPAAQAGTPRQVREGRTA